MATINKKILSLWAKEGLDLTDSAFNKLHSKESSLEEGRERYDLKPEDFRKFAKHLFDKIVRMHAIKEFLVTVGTDTKNLVKEYSTITNNDMIAARDQRWPVNPAIHATKSEHDKFTDALIKTSVVGNYIHQSLTDDAREQIEQIRSSSRLLTKTARSILTDRVIFMQLQDLLTQTMVT